MLHRVKRYGDVCVWRGGGAGTNSECAGGGGACVLFFFCVSVLRFVLAFVGLVSVGLFTSSGRAPWRAAAAAAADALGAAAAGAAAGAAAAAAAAAAVAAVGAAAAGTAGACPRRRPNWNWREEAKVGG